MRKSKDQPAQPTVKTDYKWTGRGALTATGLYAIIDHMKTIGFNSDRTTLLITAGGFGWHGEEGYTIVATEEK